MGFQIANEPAADQVLDEQPFAVVVGMMLDQQYGMEHAFRGGYKVLSRFGTLDPAAIAAADPDEFKAMASTPPAIHRFPGSMAARLQELAALVESRYDGDVTRYEKRLVLVRPDQYVVWDGNEAPVDAMSMLRTITGSH